MLERSAIMLCILTHLGIHGVPYGPWQDDPTQPAEPDMQAGYCTHRSVLFVPWHRPYLMLFEVVSECLIS
jgi:Common central domain of tyrosinase